MGARIGLLARGNDGLRNLITHSRLIRTSSSLSPVLSVDRQDISDAWSVELVFEEIGFQRRGLFRFQAIVERPSGTWTVCVRLRVSAKSSALFKENS